MWTCITCNVFLSHHALDYNCFTKLHNANLTENLSSLNVAVISVNNNICLNFDVSVLGHAFGAGAFLALACDYRVMRPDKGWLNWPETAIGLRFGEILLKIAR